LDPHQTNRVSKKLYTSNTINNNNNNNNTSLSSQSNRSTKDFPIKKFKRIQTNRTNTLIRKMTIKSTTDTGIPNFRQAAGLSKIYRSSAPDHEAELLAATIQDVNQNLQQQQQQQDPAQLTDAQPFLLHGVGLWIDLWRKTKIDHETLSILLEDSPWG
jgi:hypothetical protein